MKTILRWLWFQLYDEDLFVMLGQRRDLDRLNGVHVQFIERLEQAHPELSEEIKAHQNDRFNALHHEL